MYQNNNCILPQVKLRTQQICGRRLDDINVACALKVLTLTTIIPMMKHVSGRIMLFIQHLYPKKFQQADCIQRHSRPLYFTSQLCAKNHLKLYVWICCLFDSHWMTWRISPDLVSVCVKKCIFVSRRWSGGIFCVIFLVISKAKVIRKQNYFWVIPRIARFFSPCFNCSSKGLLADQVQPRGMLRLHSELNTEICISYVFSG